MPWTPAKTVFKDSAGRLLIVAGGLRGHIDGDHIVWAKRIFAARIFVTTEVRPDLWQFVDVSGSIWSADGFLADPIPLGRPVSDSFSAVRPAPGFTAVIGARGDLHIVDAAGHITQRDTLPRRSLVDAAFLNANDGAIVLEGGLALWTEDAGLTWSPVDVGFPARMVRGYDDQDLYQFVGFEDDKPAIRSFDRVGKPTRTVPVAPSQITLNDDEERALDSAIAARLPAFRNDVEAGLARPAPLYTAAYHPQPAPAPLLPQCKGIPDVLPWGPRFVALCGRSTNSDHKAPLLVSDDKRSFRPLQGEFWPVTEFPSDYVFFKDGTHAAWSGSCGLTEPGFFGQGGLCLLTDPDTGARVHLHTDSYNEAPAGSSGHYALFIADESTLRLVDAKSKTASPVAIPQGLVIQGGNLTEDGTVVVLAAEDDEEQERVLLVGPVGGELARREVPHDALVVGFMDANHGVASGRNLAGVWRTSNGGATWEPLPMPISGDASGVELSASFTSGTMIACTPEHCDLGDPEVYGARVRVRGWGPGTASSEQLVGPQPRDLYATPIRGANITGAGSPPQLGTLVCTREESSWPPDVAPELTDAKLPRFFGPSAAGSVARRYDLREISEETRPARGSSYAAGDYQSQIQWGGSGQRGKFANSSAPVLPGRTPFLPKADASRERAPEVLHAARDRVLLRHCKVDSNSIIKRCVLSLVRPGMRPTTVADAGTSPTPPLVVSTASGGFMLALSSERGPSVVMLELSPVGKVVHRRELAFESVDWVGIEAEGDKRSLAVMSRGAIRLFGFGALDLPRIDEPLVAPIPLCSGPRTARTTDLWIRNGKLSDESYHWTNPMTAIVERTGDSACLRAVERWANHPVGSLLKGGGGRLEAAPDNTLKGAMTDWRGRAQTTCVVQ